MRYFLSLLTLPFLSVAAHAGIVLGVLAPQGVEQAEARWSQLAASVSEELGTDVTLYAVGAVDGTEAFLDGYVDLLLGNPVQTAVVVDTMGAVPLASLVMRGGDQFAGVIAVPAESDITTLEELRGKRIGALGDWAAGGYIFQADYLIQAGLVAPDALGERLRASDQNELVAMAMDGRADAIFIRTGIIENLTSKGTLAPGALRVLAEKSSGDGDLHRTTGWFPEWAVVAHPSLDSDVSDRVGRVLIGLSETDQAVQAAGIAGFQEPLDISPVVEAMQRVGVAPYN